MKGEQPVFVCKKKRNEEEEGFGGEIHPEFEFEKARI
jgi:hypothetical protein